MAEDAGAIFRLFDKKSLVEGIATLAIEGDFIKRAAMYRIDKGQFSCYTSSIEFVLSLKPQALQGAEEMDIVQYIPTQIVWAHHVIAPWGGWLLSGLILVLGLHWFYRTLRRAGRSMKRTVNHWFGQRRMVNEQVIRHRTSQELFENCATPGLIEPDPRTR